MIVKIKSIMTSAEFSALSADARERGFYSNDRRVFLPGMAWYQDWYFDPTGERPRQGKHVMVKSPDAANAGFLSVHYWRDWAAKRPPICVVCPNGAWWEIDRKSSNGEGWVVSGEGCDLTCSPSIVAGDYHGWLARGEFSPDLEGRSYSSAVTYG